MSGRLKVMDLLEAERKAVLFISTRNAVRSQMAQGFASYFAPSSIQIYSAGVTPTALDPMAITVMDELGIDIKSQTSKGLDDIDMSKIAVAISLCESDEVPPLAAHIVHLPIPVEDPTGFEGDELDRRDMYRETRSLVREVVSTLL